MGFPFAFRFFFVLFAESVGDFLLLVPWWYTFGLVRALKGAGRSIVRRERQLALGLWITSLWKPMYGQEDWQGKFISFIFRILILIWRTIFFFLWLALVGVFFLAYCLLPLLAIYGIIHTIA